ncbi:phosphate acyltransferase PlsX [Pseudogracilibacillus sp. SO10305]|uniref:phosphate acyltransferase PlsX n=1 Tax=Pseudogracilibacillus sp. SO10305 TaxID=3098292 RepID=UPI00300E64F9
MKLALDAMGGDHAPKVIVEGAMAAIKDKQDLEITLIGDEAKIRSFLTDGERINIIHTEEMIEADDEPIRAVRRKKQASVVLMANEVKEKRADACISAGNTGALVVAGLFGVGRIKGIERPALSPTLPTIDQHGFLLLDAGANVDATPKNLLQYGVMGSIYCEKVRHIKRPRVALLNVGTETGKGNALTKKAYELLSEAPINFIGNVEARDLLDGVADVIVTDGFSGNVTLKSIEGTALHVMKLLKGTLTSSLKTKLAAGLIKKDLSQLKEALDYPEYGGASLFGLAAPVIKSHGSSNERAIYHTILQACEMVEQNMVKTISETIATLQVDEEEK